MKILRLRAYCYPENIAASAMTEDIEEEYVRRGIFCISYTPMPSRGVSDEVRRRYKKIKYEENFDGHVIVHRFPMIKEGTSIVQKTLKYLLCTIVEYFKGISERDIDLMLCSSTPPTQGMLAVMVAKKLGRKYGRKVPFVYNLQDIFPDSLVGTGLAKKGGILWKIGRGIENFTYRNADKIIVISEDFKRNIMAKGVPEEKIEVIYNWVDENAVVDIPREQNKLFDKYNLDRSKFYIEYSGNIGLTQNMDMLMEVMKELKDSYPDIGLVLVGEGVYKKQVEEIVARYGLTNVTMLPFQPYEDISHVFSLGNVGLVISKPGVGANSVPSKTWSIMSASRPVLANFDPNELQGIMEGSHPFSEEGKPCGIFTKAGDKEAFKAAILRLYENRALCLEYGRNGREFILRNLTKEVGTGKYVEVIRGFAHDDDNDNDDDDEVKNR